MSETNNWFDEDDDLEHCFECSGYGDDYWFNDDGELEWFCPFCPLNPDNEKGE